MARTQSTQAQAAKAIRIELKAAFPGTKFSVKSSGFSGGDAVDIRWTDGPTTNQVDEITGKYQYGHFDGMTDYYEYSNSRDDIPQTKYVMAQRDYSPEAIQKALDHIRDEYHVENPGTPEEYLNGSLWDRQVCQNTHERHWSVQETAGRWLSAWSECEERETPEPHSDTVAPEEPQEATEIDPEFMGKVIEAMDAALAPYRPGKELWYDNREYQKTLLDADEKGIVKRRSYTQVHWTDKGVELARKHRKAQESSLTRYPSGLTRLAIPEGGPTFERIGTMEAQMTSEHAKTEHTPGPWRVGGNIVTGILDSENRVVAVPGTLDFPDDYNVTANARLIAAAPELLEALKELVRAMEDPQSKARAVREIAAMSIARATISKATGGQA